MNLHQDEFWICAPPGGEPSRRHPGAMVSGAYGEYFTIDTAAHASIIGVHFSPGGARPFARLSEPPARSGAVRVALELLGRSGMTVGDVAARLQLSRRRLVELFTAEVGMTPKLFARVRRLERARALARQAGRADWGAIALASGYSDQPHLIREFRAFSGFSPAELARRGGQGGARRRTELNVDGS